MSLSYMQRLPILDVYVLSMLDRGMQSPYDLQKNAGLSLGASTPALERLRKAGMVTRTMDRSRGKRKRFEFALTQTGRRALQTKWRAYLDTQPPSDIDSVLRVIDMGLHYKASPADVARFAIQAAEARIIKSQQLAPKTLGRSGTAVSIYQLLRSECDHATLKAEAAAVAAIAHRLGGVKGAKRSRKKSRVLAGQQNLTYSDS